MFCKNCGAELPEQAKFCPQCACPVESKPADPAKAATVPAPDQSKSAASAPNAGSTQAASRASVNPSATATAKGQPCTITFRSLVEADEWLAKQNNIVISKFGVSTMSVPGLYANHPVADRVRIQYSRVSQPTGYVYGVAEEELLQIRSWKSQFDGNFHAVWDKAYPDLPCVSYTNFMSTQTTYTGTENGPMNVSAVSSYTKYFVLYQEKGNTRSVSPDHFGHAFDSINDPVYQHLAYNNWFFFLHIPFCIFGWFYYQIISKQYGSAMNEYELKYHQEYYSQWKRKIKMWGKRLLILVGIAVVIVAIVLSIEGALGYLS